MDTHLKRCAIVCDASSDQHPCLCVWVTHWVAVDARVMHLLADKSQRSTIILSYALDFNSFFFPSLTLASLSLVSRGIWFVDFSHFERTHRILSPPNKNVVRVYDTRHFTTFITTTNNKKTLQKFDCFFFHSVSFSSSRAISCSLLMMPLLISKCLLWRREHRVEKKDTTATTNPCSFGRVEWANIYH